MESRFEQLLARRRFLELAGTGIGSAALASLFGPDLLAQAPGAPAGLGALPGLPHHAPKAKRIIYLFQSGAPSQHELWDYKPTLQQRMGEDLPPSVRGDQRVTTMTAGQERFPLVPSKFSFAQHGQSQAWVSELMPHTAKIVDDLCFIKSMHTEAINHDPGITFFQTGAQLAGRPSMGAWLSYGLGSLNSDLPTFVAMVSKGSAQAGQPLYDRLWGSGFLPSRYQGVKFLATGDPRALSVEPARGRPRYASSFSRRPRCAQWPERGRVRGPRNQHPDLAIRDGVSHADVRAGAGRLV